MGRIGKPWRHFFGQHCLAHGFGPRPRILISEQRHGRRFARTMALLTAMLQDRKNIFVKGDVAGAGDHGKCAPHYPETHDYPPPGGFLDYTSSLKEFFSAARRVNAISGSCPKPQNHPSAAAWPSHFILLSMLSSGYRSNAATQVGWRCAAVGARSERKQKVPRPDDAVITIMSRLCPGAEHIRIPGAIWAPSATKFIRPLFTSGS